VGYGEHPQMLSIAAPRPSGLRIAPGVGGAPGPAKKREAEIVRTAPLRCKRQAAFFLQLCATHLGGVHRTDPQAAFRPGVLTVTVLIGSPHPIAKNITHSIFTGATDSARDGHFLPIRSSRAARSVRSNEKKPTGCNRSASKVKHTSSAERSEPQSASEEECFAHVESGSGGIGVTHLAIEDPAGFEK
jgi:hypothetical protein